MIEIVHHKQMKRKGLSLAVYAVLLVVLVTMTSCSAFAPGPIAPPVPTENPVPTSTFTLQPTLTGTPTPLPTSTSVPPTATPEELVLPMPDGELLVSWQGFPIMPGAIAGEEDDDIYTFVIEASPDEVWAYYERELAKLGYGLMATGVNDAGEMKMLMFIGDGNSLSMFFVPNRDGSLMVSLIST